MKIITINTFIVHQTQKRLLFYDYNRAFVPKWLSKHWKCPVFFFVVYERNDMV